MTTPAAPVGFIGLGRMGRPIVRRLLAAGHHVLVHDIDPAARRASVADGAAAPGNAADLARAVRVLFTCLPGPGEVEAVLGGPAGALASLPPGGVAVEMSTVSPATGRDLARLAEAHGVGFIDAPLSGGVDSAVAGTLVMMAGGRPATVDAIRPLAACFAPHVFHLGAAGSGYLAKAINQAIYLSYAASFCEAAALGAASGLEVPVLLDVLRRSVGGQPLMTRWEERIATGDLAGGFQVGRVLKDLAMAQAACHDIAFPAAILDAVAAAFRSAAEAGHVAHDMTALYQMKRDFRAG